MGPGLDHGGLAAAGDLYSRAQHFWWARYSIQHLVTSRRDGTRLASLSGTV